MCRCNFHLWTFSNHKAFLEVCSILFEDTQYEKTSGPSGMVLVVTKYFDNEIKMRRDSYPYDDLLKFADEGKIQLNEIPFHDWKSFKTTIDFIAKKNLIDIFGVVQIELNLSLAL
jgi:hypothetical protein